MSLWIRKGDRAGQWFYFLVEVPVAIAVPVIGIVIAVLLGSLSVNPTRTLLACFSIAATGSVLIGIAKWSLFRRGILVSFGSAGMSRIMRAFYRTGWQPPPSS